MTSKRANDLQGLNILLRLPSVRLTSLKESQWSRLLDDVYFAVFGEQRHGFAEDHFHRLMEPAGLRAAQEGLRGKMEAALSLKGDNLAAWLNLGEQRLYIATGGGRVRVRYLCNDCPTMIYTALGEALTRLQIAANEIRRCANEECCALHVRLRKPHAGKPSYCSTRCQNLLGQRAYRKKRAGQLREKEQERSRRRYEEKVHAVLPGTKIARHRRKTR